MIMLVVWKRS